MAGLEAEIGRAQRAQARKQSGRSQADALCQHYRAAGGACFVRAGAGDQVASWSRKGVQVAAR